MPDEKYINTPFSQDEYKIVSKEAEKDKRPNGRMVQMLAMEAIAKRRKKKPRKST